MHFRGPHILLFCQKLAHAPCNGQLSWTFILIHGSTHIKSMPGVVVIWYCAPKLKSIDEKFSSVVWTKHVKIYI